MERQIRLQTRPRDQLAATVRVPCSAGIDVYNLRFQYITSERIIRSLQDFAPVEGRDQLCGCSSELLNTVDRPSARLLAQYSSALEAGRIVYHREPQSLLVSPKQVISDSITAHAGCVFESASCTWGPAQSGAPVGSGQLDMSEMTNVNCCYWDERRTAHPAT